MKTFLIIGRIILIISAIALVWLGITAGGLIGFFVLIAAADLICTAIWKPLIKAGPIAKWLWNNPDL